MAATYSVSVDPSCDLAVIVLSGFFKREEFDDFVRLRDAEYGKLRSAPHQHVTLVDMRAMDIQSQEAVAQFSALLANPRFHSRKLAFVVTASLARMQIARAADGRTARFFTDFDEAHAWVMEPRAAAA